jgi:hypothetical protein
MTERNKFYMLLVLLLASIALVIFIRSTFGQDFVQNL